MKYLIIFFTSIIVVIVLFMNCLSQGRCDSSHCPCLGTYFPFLLLIFFIGFFIGFIALIAFIASKISSKKSKNHKDEENKEIYKEDQKFWKEIKTAEPPCLRCFICLNKCRTIFIASGPFCSPLRIVDDVKICLMKIKKRDYSPMETVSMIVWLFGKVLCFYWLVYNAAIFQKSSFSGSALNSWTIVPVETTTDSARISSLTRVPHYSAASNLEKKRIT